jgi:hypothetical protein
MSRDQWDDAIHAILQQPGALTPETELQIGMIVLLLDIRDRLPPMAIDRP